MNGLPEKDAIANGLESNVAVISEVVGGVQQMACSQKTHFFPLYSYTIRVKLLTRTTTKGL
jgi:hypothetical protein